MLFNSIEFAIFLPIVFSVYWLLKYSCKSQNILLLLASYFFYGWWDWRFLFLIVFSSTLDYIVGLKIDKQQSKIFRKIFLLISIIINIGFLVIFKYFNFFAESFANAFTLFGKEFDIFRLNILLPVGISFYTFQTLSYSIDVYKGKISATRDLISFFAFVSFFPQLVAGPIERASALLPQFHRNRKFDYSESVEGMRQILWGLFKKIVIADNCAFYVNDIFSNYTDYSGSTLILGAILFAFQIYGDFSGYSDIAIGTARLFGFHLMQNFAFPYFSRDIAEFWRRWHISLSTWFRDYIYIPLGGSRGNIYQKVRNIFIIFIISGMWHGANWTFLVWGLLHSIFFLPLMFLKLNRKNINDISNNRLFPTVFETFQMIITFMLTSFAWIFFRANDLQHAFSYIDSIFNPSVLSPIEIFPKETLFFILILLVLEWIQKNQLFGLGNLERLIRFRSIRWGIYFLLIMIIFTFGGSQQEFIYFQF